MSEKQTADENVQMMPCLLKNNGMIGELTTFLQYKRCFNEDCFFYKNKKPRSFKTP